MKFRIVSDGIKDGGFIVQWMAADNVAVITEVSGFATHESAQQFVRDLMVQMMKAYQKVN